MESRKIVNLTLYLTFGISGVVFNATEIILIIRKLRKKKSATTFELFLLSLSCADLLVAASMLTAVQGFQELLGDSLRFATSTSILNILAIGIDRFMVVKYPLKHRVWVSSGRAKVLILFTWLFSLIFAVIMGILSRLDPHSSDPVLVHESATVVYISSPIILLFGVIFVILHIYIVWKVIWKGPGMERLHTGNGSNSGSKFQRTTGSVYQRPLLITCVLVVLSYVICMFPVSIETLIHAGKKNRYSNTIYLVYFNSVLDPLVYFYKSYMERKISKYTLSKYKEDTTKRIIINNHTKDESKSDREETTEA